jgi:hypothetical protein
MIMQTGEPSRLDRIEALLERFIIVGTLDRQASNERMTQFEEGLQRLERLMETNHRESHERLVELEQGLQAISRDVAVLVDTQQAAASERQELREATLGIANLLASLDSDRPTVLRKLNSIEGKVDRLLDSGNNV